MKGEILFEKMTGISEEYITEAALVPALGASPAEKPESRFAALSRVLNSGWGVACICFIVAIAAVVGMVAWGRMGDPVGPGYTPPTRGNFSFSHSVSLLSGPVPVGTDLRLDTSVKNEGAPFTYEGSSTGFAPTAALVHAETGYSIEGYFPMTKDYVTFTVNTGDVGTCVQTFSIPEDAPTGVYDLVLSYGGERQVFSRMVSVVIPTDTPIIYSDYSFGYEPFGGFAIPGDRLTMETWVRNDGYLFTFMGSSMGFAPAAVLVHSDTGYRIEGMFDVTADYTEVTVKPGDIGRATQEFFIPADAPTGDYDLELSYDSFSQRFDNVLTVAEPTIPDHGDTENLSFSFDYELQNSPDPAYAAWQAGDTILIKVSVTNQGAPFTYTGSSGDFIPYPELYLETVDNTRLTLHGTTPLPEDTGTFTVSTGQTGTAVYKFVLPDDIPAGSLEFAMSYAGKGTGKYSFGYISNASYTKEEAIAFATKQLSERHPELDLSQYVPRCIDSLGAGFDYKVQFQYQYYGYTVIGGKTVTVSLAADKKLLGIETEDEYAAYMEVLTENVFLAAIQNIRNRILEIDQAADPTEIMENLLSFQIDAEGYLCLTMEYIGPPRYDENGNNLSGCIDHEHYFFTERLCSKP